MDVPGPRLIKARHDRAEREETLPIRYRRAVKLESLIAARGVRVAGVVVNPIRVHLPNLHSIANQRRTTPIQQVPV